MFNLNLKGIKNKAGDYQLNHGKIICRDLGSILLIVSAVNLFTIIVSVFYAEYNQIPWILLTSGIFAVIGMILRLIGRTTEVTRLRHAVTIAALSWILIPAITTIPFMFITKLDFLSSLFETMSGWTTTGLSMFTGQEEQLSHTILFYRSFMQWIGGIGIVVLSLNILASRGTGAYHLFQAETRTDEDKIKPSIKSTMNFVWRIYIFYTIIGIILLSVFGMPVWDAINNTMTALSTGGFAIRGTSIGSYNSVIAEILIIVLMLIGATSFVTHSKLLRGKIREFLKYPQVPVLIFLCIFGAFLVAYFNLSYYNGNWLTSIRYSSFQFFSAQTTTGFQTMDIAQWGSLAKLLLSIAMIIGAAAGSTGGGIKVIRLIILTKEVKWHCKKVISSPHRILSYRLGEKNLTREEKDDIVNEAGIISFLWIIFLFVGVAVLLLTVSGYSFDDVFFEVCSAQGNCGLSVGITKVMMEPIAKFMLVVNMYIGRLEIIPIIAMFVTIFRKQI